VLVKSPEPALRRGQGADDRELRGALEVEPAPGGFILVNETGVEEYLASVLPGALAPGSPPEALKSLAVLLRSLVAEALSRPPSHAGGSPLCDSPHCRPYEGLARESSSTSRAVRETAGTVLRGGARLEFHADRGFSPAAGLSPSALERRLRPSAQARASRWNRWVRVLEGSSLRANAERLGRTGALKGVRVLRRGPDGRVEAMEVRGRGGSLALEGERDIAAFLSPGSLRSTLFSIEPLYRNGELRRIILWGAGTGHGRGLDAASASAQAERGLSFAEILSGAFPGSRLSGANGEAR
jgi:SpoIID/LytB domain protein